MKLFIVNKDLFDKTYQSRETQKKIHQKAYNSLMLSLGYDDTIPEFIEINTEIDIACFSFLNKNNDVYFFEFKSI